MSSESLLFYDFYAFYGASDLALSGKDFYSLQEFWRALETQGSNEAILNLVPPWSIWLISWLAVFPFSIAAALWSTIGAVSVGFSLRRLREMLGLKEGFPPLFAVSFLITFLPILKSLAYGQSTLIVLGAIVLCDTLMRHQKPLLAGLALSVGLIKPQLLAVALFVFLFAGEAKWRRALLGVALGGVTQLLLSLAIVPHALSSLAYNWVSISGFVRDYPMPSLIKILNFSGDLRISLVLQVIYAVVLTYIIRKRSLDKDFLTILIPASVIGAPYAWSHDFVLLFFPAAIVALYFWTQDRTRTLACLILLFLVCSVLTIRPYYEQILVLAPPMILGTFIFIQGRLRTRMA